MQYVRSLGGSVSKTWNSINPSNLSGAIDVIVVEQEDGEELCSPLDGELELKQLRNTCVLAFPRPLWQILPPQAIREEGG